MSEQILIKQMEKLEKEEPFSLFLKSHKSTHFIKLSLSSKLNLSLDKTNYLIWQLIKRGNLYMNIYDRNLDEYYIESGINE